MSDPTAVAEAYSNDPESVAFLGSASGRGALENERANAWESRFGWRVDVMAGAAYLGGPVTGAWPCAVRLNGCDADDRSAALADTRDPQRLCPVPRQVYLYTSRCAYSDSCAAYQSALLTTPLLVLVLVFNLLITLPAFFRTVFLVVAVGVTLYAAFRAWKDAQEGLERFWLPYIGPVAERWVSEE